MTQTTGFAKEADDPRMRWLRPGEVPTLGHWMQQAGYDTYYDGKWHVSDADLVDGASGRSVSTNTAGGRVLPEAVRAYREADPLRPFGFTGWVGPEPHGPRRSNSGLVRDPLTAERVVQWLDARNRRRLAGERDAARPFLLFVSFLNPHDIVFWPRWALSSPLKQSALDPPPVPDAPTEHEDLRDKPATQAAYRDAYPGLYGPPHLVRLLYERRAPAYRAAYLRLHAEVDRSIGRVLQAALAGPRADRTIFVFSSDHGELLGAHGGLHQKWLNLYDEAVRVPFVVAHTGAFGPRNRIVADELSSHVDVLPTLFGLAGLAPDELAERLARTHSEVHPLPGRDLSELVSGRREADRSRAVYVMTSDHVAEGADERTIGARLLGRRRARGAGVMALPAYVSTNMEAVIVYAEGPKGQRLYKLVRTYDDPETWTVPSVSNLALRDCFGRVDRAEPIADAFELYDLDDDPAEAHNRARDPAHAALLQMLVARLRVERARAAPARNRPWPSVAARPSETTAPARPSPRPGGPRQVTAQRRIVPSPAADVWAILEGFGDLSQWFRLATHSSMLTPHERGVGARRRVQLPMVTLTERIVEWDPPRALAYVIEGLPPLVASAKNRWILRPLDGSRTEVELVSDVTLSPGLASEALAGTVLAQLLSGPSRRLLGALARATSRAAHEGVERRLLRSPTA